jgi:hypothetical protein
MQHPFASMIVKFVLAVYTVITGTAVYDMVTCRSTKAGSCEAERSALGEVSTRVPAVLFAWLADSPVTGSGGEEPSRKRSTSPGRKQDDEDEKDPRNDPEPMGR